MFKLIVLSALVAIAVAEPFDDHTLLTKSYVGAPLIKSYAATPLIKSYSAPLVKSYATPLVKSYAATPLIKSYSAPLIKSYSAPLAYRYASHYGDYDHGFRSLPLNYAW